jgi:nitrate/nitrite-specific signal transduction histidine kinase
MADDRMEQMLDVINEKYEDDFFRLAMHYAAEKEGNLLFEEIKELSKEPDNHPSQEHIKKFTKQLDTHLKKIVRTSRNRHFSKILNKAAVVMLALIVVFSAAMFTVNAFRVRVLNFLISIEPKYTSIQLDDNSDDSNRGQPIVNWTNAYVPTYVSLPFKGL